MLNPKKLNGNVYIHVFFIGVLILQLPPTSMLYVQKNFRSRGLEYEVLVHFCQQLLHQSIIIIYLLEISTPPPPPHPHPDNPTSQTYRHTLGIFTMYHVLIFAWQKGRE